MPEKETLEAARRDKAEGKSPSTQAGEFVREEIHHIREGKHGARSTKQAIAIGLSKARRAGVRLPATGSKGTRRKAAQDSARAGRTPSQKRARASRKRLEREGRADGVAPRPGSAGAVERAPPLGRPAFGRRAQGRQDSQALTA
jgi:hypothetical protein